MALTNAPDDPLGNELGNVLINQFGFQIDIRIESRSGSFARKVQFNINFEEILFCIPNESEHFDRLFVFYRIPGHVSFLEKKAAVGDDLFKFGGNFEQLFFGIAPSRYVIDVSAISQKISCL